MSKENQITKSINFTSVVATQFHGESTLGDVLSTLPRFSEGDPENPGKGYQSIDDTHTDHLSRIISRPPARGRFHSGSGNNLNPLDGDELKSYLDSDRDGRSSLTFEFEYEVFKEQEAAVDGERRDVHVPETRRALGHWREDGALFLRGRPRTVDMVIGDLQKELESHISFEKVEIDSDFLLWLFYNWRSNGEASSILEVDDITHVRISGNNERSERMEFRLESEKDPEQALARIISGGKLIEIGGKFRVDGIGFYGNMDTRGSLSVTTLWSDTESEPQEMVHFHSGLAQKLIDLFGYWSDLEAENRYPEPSFFVPSSSELNNALESTTSLNEVMETYVLKRRHGRVPPEETEPESSDEPMPNPRREDIYEGMTLGDALEAVESEILEAKKSLPDNIDNIAKEVAALANTRGGVLILGLSDEGELVGLSSVREVEERVAGVITQSIEPPVDVNVMRRSIAESDLLIVTVSEIADTPRSVNGKYYKRVGTIVQEMGPEELTQIIQEKG